MFIFSQKLFEHPMAEFRIIITGVWTKDGSWKDLIGTKQGKKETGKKSKAKHNAGKGFSACKVC